MDQISFENQELFGDYEILQQTQITCKLLHTML